jgi:hypothetical protein
MFSGLDLIRLDTIRLDKDAPPRNAIDLVIEHPSTGQSSSFLEDVVEAELLCNYTHSDEDLMTERPERRAWLGLGLGLGARI